MNHLELFAGVGGFRRAMDLISQDLNFPIYTVAYSEIDSKAIDTYNAYYDTTNETAMGNITYFVRNKRAMMGLPNYDILSGGFPCQTFSMMGKQEGFEEERGQMFFRIMDMVNDRHPSFVLLENVKNLMRHDGGNTIAIIIRELTQAGYTVKIDVFNSYDYGLPQKRNRVILFARRSCMGDYAFNAELVKKTFDQIDRKKCSLSFYNSVNEILDKKVEKKYYLSEKIKPTILSDGSAGFMSQSDIDQVVARPLTASMHKMHRACQDNYYSDIFIRSNGRERPSERLTKEELARIPIRKLTPKEAFMLQGFPADFANKASIAKVADGAMYRQAGNAVSVNTIYAVLYYLLTSKIVYEE